MRAGRRPPQFASKYDAFELPAANLVVNMQLLDVLEWICSYAFELPATGLLVNTMFWDALGWI